MPISSKEDKWNVNQSVNKLVNQRKIKDLRQFYIGSFDIRLSDIEYNYLQTVHERLIRREEDASDFRKICVMMIMKSVVFKDLMESTGKTYLAAIYLMNLQSSETKGRAFDPKKARNKDTDKVGAYYLYSSTAMDLSKETFKEAIANSNYRTIVLHQLAA